MARVEIAFPETVQFTTELPVRIDDVNYGGHLANDAVLRLAQEARLRFLVSLGFRSELDVGGTGLVMKDAAVVYRSEGRYGDVLRIELALSDVRTRGFDLLYRLTERGGREVALVKTGLLWFDYTARKVVSMPEAFRAAVGQLGPDAPAA